MTAGSPSFFHFPLLLFHRFTDIEEHTSPLKTWHPRREAPSKRRLTSDRFLAVYDKILQLDGIIEFKTDNQDLFRYSLESIPEAGWQVTSHTFDLHHSDMAEGNVMTEYETKFSAEGKPICKLTARRDKS